MQQRFSDFVSVSAGLLLGAAITVLHALCPVTYPIFGAWSAVICSVMCLLFSLLAGKPTERSSPAVTRLRVSSGVTLALSAAAIALPCDGESLLCIFLVTSALACQLIMFARFYACLAELPDD